MSVTMENACKNEKRVKTFLEVDVSDLKMPIIGVYAHPEDYPEKCVARIFDVDRPTDVVLVKDDISGVREDIRKAFPYMTPFPPGTEDVPCLVEAWI